MSEYIAPTTRLSCGFLHTKKPAGTVSQRQKYLLYLISRSSIDSTIELAFARDDVEQASRNLNACLNGADHVKPERGVQPDVILIPLVKTAQQILHAGVEINVNEKIDVAAYHPALFDVAVELAFVFEVLHEGALKFFGVCVTEKITDEMADDAKLVGQHDRVEP